jgi:uncharacterized protein YraI
MLLKKVLALLVLSSLFAMMIVPAVAQDATATPIPGSVATTNLYVEAFRKVNVRSGPGIKYTKIGALNLGDKADITGRDSEDSDWLRINLNGAEGWVSFPVIEVTGNVADAPVVEPGATAELTQTRAQQAADSSKNFTVVTRVNASLRATSSVGSDVLAVIPFGTNLEPDARTASKNRLRVTFDGQTGWVATNLVNITGGNIDTLAVAE